MTVLDIDRTFELGRVYLDVVGGVSPQYALGVTLEWQRAPWTDFGRRVTLHLLWWAITLGYDNRETEEVMSE